MKAVDVVEPQESVLGLALLVIEREDQLRELRPAAGIPLMAGASRRASGTT